jgi:hypothetical protein
MATGNETKQAFNKQGIRQADTAAGPLSIDTQEIEAMLSQKPGDISEAELWTLIASRHSIEWKAAQEHMAEVEQRLRDMNADANAPLGSIGMALDGMDIDMAEEEQRRALAHFTAVNEQLRQQKQLQDIMRSVLQNRNNLTGAIKDIRQMPGLSASFAAGTMQKTPEKSPRPVDKKQIMPTQTAFNSRSKRIEKEKIPLSNTFWLTLNDGMRVYSATMRKRLFADKANKVKAHKEKRRKNNVDVTAFVAMMFTGMF